MNRHLNNMVSGEFRPPVYVFLSVLLVVLAVTLERVFRGCPGQVSFVVLLAPTLMAAFDGGYRAALATSVVSGAGCIAAAWAALWLGRADGWGWIQIMLPIPWSVILVSCGVWFGVSLDSLRQRAHELEAQCEDHERSIYQIHKGAGSQPGASSPRGAGPVTHRVDFSVLLLNIQHLGRQLSGNLEMRAAYSLVIEAARKLLKAPTPRLFLLDEQTHELVEHTPGRPGIRHPADRGMLGWAAQNGQILAAEDLDQDYALADLRTQDPTPWSACAPLIVGGRVLGVLALDTIKEKDQQFDRLLYIVANFSAVALNNSRMFHRVEEMARRDGLTGLLNHATFQSKLAEVIKQAQNTNRALSLMLLDVDHFKQFNDRYGHQAGDHVLRSVAKLSSRLLPPEAIVARYGGEEFVCVLPGSVLDKAAKQAEQLREAMEEQELDFAGTPLRVTASFGVAQFPVNATEQAELIRQADKALYEAKRKGRNRVCTASDMDSDEARLRATTVQEDPMQSESMEEPKDAAAARM